MKKSLIKGPGAIGNYKKLDMVRIVDHGKKLTWCKEVKLSREKENFMEGSLAKIRSFNLIIKKLLDQRRDEVRSIL